MVGIQLWTYVAVPQRGSLLLYTKLEGSSFAKLDSYFLQYSLQMIFKDP